MLLSRRTLLQITTSTVAAPSLLRNASAQSYPAKPVRVVVSVPPGGTFDIVGRLASQALSERLGQSFVVENRGGAGTNIGTGFVAHASPDGYTLLIVGPPAAINQTLYTNLDFDFARDIVPVAGIERAPLIMVVNPAFPAKSVPQFIAYAKANSGKVNMGSGGIGATSHVAGELFKMMAETKIAHVPYRGEAPAITDLIAGQTQVMFSTAGSAVNFVKSGALRALAVTTTTRMPLLPEVPTLSEYLPGYEATAWGGIGAPAKTPADIVGVLNRATNAALGDEKVVSKLGSFGATVMPGSPADFKKFIDGEIEKWGKVIRFANIKAE